VPRGGLEQFPVPHDDLRSVQVCKADGYLTNNRCESREELAPRSARFRQLSPNHRLVQLDSSGTFRVDSRCATVAGTGSLAWFHLPPRQEHFYASEDANYKRLPSLHPACGGTDAASPIALLYPAERRSVYVPVDLDGSRSRAVFEAVHREPASVLHWHLDDAYLGSTETFHQMPVDTTAGSHRITLVDQNGNRLERSFDVIGPTRGGS
jgi:penicillin-binding protein 1C